VARIARVIAEGMPRHITQPGNRCQQTFFSEDDYKACLELMAGVRCNAGAQNDSYLLISNYKKRINHAENLLFFGNFNLYVLD
jgi:putative transposase